MAEKERGSCYKVNWIQSIALELKVLGAEGLKDVGQEQHIEFTVGSRVISEMCTLKVLPCSACSTVLTLTYICSPQSESELLLGGKSSNVKEI